MCRGEDLNLHELPHTVLSRARLPIPPPRQVGVILPDNAKMSYGQKAQGIFNYIGHLEFAFGVVLEDGFNFDVYVNLCIIAKN